MIFFHKNENILVVNNNRLVFDHSIRYVKEVNGILIVLLGIPFNENYINNVFGITSTGEIKWRIQNVSNVNLGKNPLPFENLMIQGNEVYISDFYGRRFSINPATGEILSSDVVR